MTEIKTKKYQDFEVNIIPALRDNYICYKNSKFEKHNNQIVSRETLEKIKILDEFETNNINVSRETSMI